MRKRFFSILLICCMVVLMIPTAVAAAEDTYSSSNLSANSMAETEVNDTSDCANKILVNTEITGSIPESSDVDWYIVQIPDDGYISLTADHDYVDNPDTALTITFYTSDNERLDVWSWLINSTSTKNGNEIGIAAGVYYLCVSPRVGYNHFSPFDYRITANYTSSSTWERESNNTITTANYVPTGTEISGTFRGDLDWYKFELPTDGVISLTFSHDYMNSSNTYWKATFYTSDNKELVSWLRKGNIMAAMPPETANEVGVPAGTYYLCISKGFSPTIYHFTVNYTPSDSWEKEFNETADTANCIPTDTEISGIIMNESDVDWYKFVLPEDGMISLSGIYDKIDHPDSFSQIYKWDTTLYTSNKKVLSSWECLPSKEGDKIGVPAGTYYLRIFVCRTSTSESYSLSPVSYNFTIDYTSSNFWEKELNETIATANWISTGTLIYGSSRNSNADVDWYRFEMPTDGRISIILYHDFNSYDEAKWNTVLYTASNKALAGWTWIHSINGAYTESGKGKAEIDVPAGTYYLCISRGKAYNHKSYSFRIDHSAISYFIETSTKPNQGGTVTGSGRYEKGKAVTVEAVANYGYTFVEWQENDSIVSTSAEYTFTAGADRSLTAVFKREQTSYYYVTYNANGGSGAPAAQTKVQGQSLTLSSTRPTRSGYTFAGWATSSTGSVQYQPGETYTGNENLTLYAVWKADTYTVTYNANGGSGAPAAQTKIQDQSLTLSSTCPTRSGYTFAGWATSSNGGAQYQPGGTYTGNANLILYAVWTPVSTAGADITVGSGTASPGGMVSIPVSIRNNPGISGTQFTISYDQSAMTLDHVDRGSVFNRGSYTGDVTNNLVQWYDTSNNTSNGTMFTLYFKVNQTARAGRYSVGLQYQANNITNQAGMTVPIKAEAGSVTVAAGRLGDVTGDGEIAMGDVVKLARAVAGYTTLTPQEKTLGDVTGDGEITISDVVRLARYVAGYISSL